MPIKIELNAEKQRQNLNYLPSTTTPLPRLSFAPSLLTPLPPHPQQCRGMAGLWSVHNGSSLPLRPTHTCPCSSLGPSHGLQSFRENLLQHGLSAGHGSFRACPHTVAWGPPWAAAWIPVPAWSSPRATGDTCSTVVSPGATGRYLLHQDPSRLTRESLLGTGCVCRGTVPASPHRDRPPHLPYLGTCTQYAVQPFSVSKEVESNG